MDLHLNWKYKAWLMKLISNLPTRLGNYCHYQLQRTWGGHNKLHTFQQLKASINILGLINELNYQWRNKTFLELGTGRHLNISLGLWLCGASNIFTIDINPYVKEELVLASIAWMREHEAVVRREFQDVSDPKVFNERFALLLGVKHGLEEVLEVTGIRYLAPADASNLSLAEPVVDFYFSHNVLAYIPPDLLSRIFQASARFMAPDGLHLHWVDISDYFAMGDRTIPTINFLQFSETKWRKIAGNRFMFHNRLRARDYQTMLSEGLGLTFLLWEESIDHRAVASISQGFPIAPCFQGYSPEELAVANIRFACRFTHNGKTL